MFSKLFQDNNNINEKSVVGFGLCLIIPDGVKKMIIGVNFSNVGQNSRDYF